MTQGQSVQAFPLDPARPTIIIVFEAADKHRFASQYFFNPQEGQIELAGRELIALAKMLRETRLLSQLKPKQGDGTASQPIQALPNSGKQG